MNRLKDKVILITGAGKGSGKLLAIALAERGGIVAANDITPINVDTVVEEVVKQGGSAKAYIEDIAKKVGVQSLVNEVEGEFGRIDILINHASVQPNVPLLKMDEWDWHRVLDVNLTGAFLMIQSVGRVMRVQGSGMMINLIEENQASFKDEAAFVASMQGLKALTRQAARELDPYGIRVHAVGIGNDVVESVLDLLEEQ